MLAATASLAPGIFLSLNLITMPFCEPADIVSAVLQFYNKKFHKKRFFEKMLHVHKGAYILILTEV
jgi:hypothetical protein